MLKKILYLFFISFFFYSPSLAFSNLGTLTESITAGKVLSVGLNTSATGAWYVGSISDNTVVSAKISSSNLLINGLKQGSAKILACTDVRNDACLEVNVTVSSSGNVLGAYTEKAHDNKTWVISGKTVFYVDGSGLIPITEWNIFVKNGGKTKFIKPVNSGDLALRLESFMTLNDPRVKK